MAIRFNNPKTSPKPGPLLHHNIAISLTRLRQHFGAPTIGSTLVIAWSTVRSLFSEFGELFGYTNDPIRIWVCQSKYYVCNTHIPYASEIASNILNRPSERSPRGPFLFDSFTSYSMLILCALAGRAGTSAMIPFNARVANTSRRSWDSSFTVLFVHFLVRSCPSFNNL